MGKAHASDGWEWLGPRGPASSPWVAPIRSGLPHAITPIVMRRQRHSSRSPLGLTSLFTACVSLAVVGCSSSDDSPTDTTPDTTAPTASGLQQDRVTDSTGQTVAVTFSEAVTSATAEVAGSYTFSGGITTQTATLRGDGRTVDLVLDGPAIPGDNSISIAAGIEDAAGNASDAVTNQAITSTDTAAPGAISIAGTTIAGAENDTVAVTFDDDMIESEVEALANWTIESPMGSAFDVTGATVDYVAGTRTATITLGAASADQNLQTFDDIHATFITMRDLGGNVAAATSIGTTAVTATIDGDRTPPMLIAAAPDSGATILLTFSEDVGGVETADLMTGPNPTGTEITMTDVSDPGVAAAGTIALTGVVADGDSVTISDGSTAVEFEFDYGAVGTVTLDTQPADTDSVTIGDGSASETFEFESGGGFSGTEVTIGSDADETTTNLITAINASVTITVTASPGASANIVDLRNDATGAAGNVTISEVDAGGTAISFTGMAGGGIAGDVEVAVDTASDTNTMSSLFSAINGDAFNVTASAGGAGTDIIITNDASGAVGNTTVTEVDSGGVITVADMTGGIDTGIATYAPTISTAVGTPFQATATYAVTPVASDTLRVYGVTDLAGNQMAPSIGFALVAADASEPALAGGGSNTVEAISGEDNDQIVVSFDMDVHPAGVTDIANYTLDDGASVDLTGATVEQTASDAVMITLGPNSDVNIGSAGTYAVSMNNLRSLQGVQRTVADSDGGVPVLGDTTAPSVGAGDAKLDPVIASAVLIEFDEAMDAAAAAAIGNYAIVGNITTAAAIVNPRVVRVTFQNQPVVSDSVEITIAGQTDLAGNAAVGNASVVIVAADDTSPTVSSVAGVTGSGRHTITVTFDEPWTPASAVAPGNYAARIVGGSAISLTGATFTASSTSDAVEIMLAEGTYITTGDDVGVTVANVMDVAGNIIVTAETTATITGDAGAPASATAFINLKESATGTIVDVTFNEAVNSTAATLIGNWAGSNGQSATAVMMIDGSTYRVTFDAAIAIADTIDASNQTDVSGNDAAGVITIAPVE